MSKLKPSLAGRAPDLIAGLWLVVFTVAVWARPVLGGFNHLRLSNPGDSNAFEFYIAWNSYALTHALDPFFTRVMYAPHGLDLGNAISIPAPSLLVAPVTLLFGPTAAYNVAFLLPVFLASMAIYLLARELGSDRIGATAAGSLMVLAPYFSGHALGHMNLMWIFGLPTIAWAVARNVRGRMTMPWLIAVAAFAVAFTLGSSTELFVTEIVFGLLAWVIALWLAEGDLRRRVLRAGAATAAGGVGGLVLSIPIIYVALRSGIPEVAVNPAAAYPTDLYNLVVPTEVMEFGSDRFAEVRADWLGNGAENTAYLTVPLVVLLGFSLFVARRDRRITGLLGFAGIALLCSFGPILTIDGGQHFRMPWSLAGHVPVVEHALPVRFSAFVWMAVVVVVALVWTSRRIPRGVTAVLALMASVLLLPSLPAMSIPVDTSVPRYFTDGSWRQDINPGDNVLVLAPGEAGPGLRWSAVTDFAFNTPTGNGGGASLPPALQDRTGAALFWHQFNPDVQYNWPKMLPRYLDKLGIRHVLVDPSDRYWRDVMEDVFPGQGAEKRGVVVYEVPQRG